MCDRCDSYFVAPCFVNTICVMLCKDCSELYNAEINKPLLDMSWARAVKEWNSGQIFRDDMYAIPRKTGEYYGEVKEIMDKSKHKKDVTKMMGKEPARDEVVMKPGDSFFTQGPGTVAPPKLTEEGNLIQITEDTTADMLKIRQIYYKLNKTMQKKEKARYEELFQQTEKKYDAAIEKLKKEYPKSKYPEKPSFSLDDTFSERYKEELVKFNLWDDYKKYNILFNTLKRGDILAHKDGQRLVVQNVSRPQRENLIAPTFSLKENGKQALLVEVSVKRKPYTSQPQLTLATVHRTQGARQLDLGDLEEWKVIKQNE